MEKQDCRDDTLAFFATYSEGRAEGETHTLLVCCR